MIAILFSMRNDERFDKLASLFLKHGKSLYIVGGSSRDLLLGREYSDHDFVTDALPSEMKEIIPEANFTFARFGSVRLMVDKEEVDITTLREEGEYKDHRHPSYIRFINDLEKDSYRRDFTINALYINKDYKISDFHGGLDDLRNGLIRFIGDPEKRIEEDPLRILRAERFAEKLSFKIEEKSKMAIERKRYLLSELNPDKIKEEERKRKKDE